MILSDRDIALAPAREGEAAKVYVVPRGEKWAVRREGVAGYVSTHATLNEAVIAGRDLAELERAPLVIQNVERRARSRDLPPIAVAS